MAVEATRAIGDADAGPKTKIVPCWRSISDDFDHQHYSRIYVYKA
jgi:hypothetical protein